MYQLHDGLLRPMLRAVGARHILEIGADQADHTRLLVDYVTEVGGRLQVIEPTISAPLAELAATSSAMTVHEGKSLDLLDTMAVPDVAVIDGDHNHFTVEGELRAIRQAAADAGSPRPLLLIHDVGWPYGRRDMYYDPADVPEDRRHPHLPKGIRLGRSELAEDGTVGFNQGFANAEHEGGARNGVLTAVEDVVAETAGWALYVFHGLHGVAVVADEDVVAGNDELRAILELSSNPVVHALTAAIEHGRLSALQDMHDQAWRAALAEQASAQTAERLSEAQTTWETELAEMRDRLADLEQQLAASTDELTLLRDQQAHPVRHLLGRVADRARPGR